MVALAIRPSQSDQSPAPFMKSRPWRWKLGEGMIFWVMWICKVLLRPPLTTADRFILYPTYSESSPSLGWIRVSENGGKKGCDISTPRSNGLDS